MTGRTRWHRYADHLGPTISVRAVQNASGDWVEEWSFRQVMAVVLSRESDTSLEPSVVYRSASNNSRGPQPRSTAPNRPNSPNRTRTERNNDG